MNGVQAIEQLPRKGAGGDSIEERDSGPRDEPDGGRRPARGLESSKQFDQHVLNGRRHLLDSVNQHAAACRTVKHADAVLPKRLRSDREIASPQAYEGRLRTRAGPVNASSKRFRPSFGRRRDEEPRRTSARDLLVRSGGQRSCVSSYAMHSARSHEVRSANDGTDGSNPRRHAPPPPASIDRRRI